MAIPDVNQWTEQEWDQIIAAIQQAKVTKEIQKQQEAEALLSNIGEAISSVQALIGPDNPTVPGLNSLTEIQRYTDAQMAANAGKAHRLTFIGMEILARAVEDIGIHVAGLPEIP